MRSIRSILATLLLGAAACSAHSVRPPDRDGGPRTGVVKYQVSHVRRIDADRRIDAHARMRTSCGGPYRVVAERTRNEHAVVYGGGRRRDRRVQPVVYHYIEYACESGAPPREHH
jgi:hypothetical protein